MSKSIECQSCFNCTHKMSRINEWIPEQGILDVDDYATECSMISQVITDEDGNTVNDKPCYMYKSILEVAV